MMNAGKRLSKRLLRIPLYPVLRYFGPRFHNVHAGLETLNVRFDELSNKLAQTAQGFEKLEERISTDLESSIEIFTLVQRTTARLEQRIAHLEGLLQAANGEVSSKGRPSGSPEAPTQGLRQDHGSEDQASTMPRGLPGEPGFSGRPQASL